MIDGLYSVTRNCGPAYDYVQSSNLNAIYIIQLNPDLPRSLGKGNIRGISGFAVNQGAVNRGFTVHGMLGGPPMLHLTWDKLISSKLMICGELTPGHCEPC